MEKELNEIIEEMTDFFADRLIAYGNKRFQEGKDWKDPAPTNLTSGE